MAKEAKTVRAAALSVGIFMMTSAAGAAPAFANVTAFLRLGDTLLSGPSAPSYLGEPWFPKPRTFDGITECAKVYHGVLQR